MAGLGVCGLVLGGITSEVHKLSTEEKRSIVSLTASEFGGRMPLVAGCGEASFELTRDSVHHAASCGAFAAMIFPAFAVAAGPGMVRSLFEFCSGSLPLILQDASFFGGQPLEPSSIASIVNDNPAIAAIKIESPPSATRMRAVSRLLARPVSLISGQGGQYLTYELSAGATALFPGPAFPQIYLQFFPHPSPPPQAGEGVSEPDATGLLTESQAVFRSPDRSELPLGLLRFMFQSAEFAIACYKQILVDKSVISSARTRQPGVELDAESVETLRRLAREAGV